MFPRIKYLLLALLAFSTLHLFSQSADEPKGCAPHTVNFKAELPLATYYWDFGDNSSSISENPSKNYLNPGIYIVILRESESGDEKGRIQVEIYTKPTLDIQRSNLTGCSPFNTTLVDSSSYDPNISIVSYLWDFGDGSPLGSSSTGSINHTYNSVNEFDVTMDVTTNLSSCNDRAKVVNDLVQVVDEPSTSFNTTPASLLACSGPLEVSFENTSQGQFPLNYSWDLGNGNTSTAANPTPQTYTTDGQYAINLRASYDFGCSSTDQKVVSIGSPNATIAQSEPVDCENNTMILSSPVAGAQYSWEVNGVVQSTSQSFVPTLNTGDNTVKLTLTSSDGLCNDTAETIVVKDDLSLSITSDNSYQCVSPALFNYTATTNQPDATISWIFNDGTLVTDSLTPSFSYSVQSLNDVNGVNDRELVTTTATLENANGCLISQTLVDTVWFPNADLYSGGRRIEIISGCVPLDVDFADSSFSDGALISRQLVLGNGDVVPLTDAGLNYTYTTSGDFEAILIIQNDRGCIDTSNIIKVEAGDTLIKPNFSINPERLCWDEELTLTNLIETDLEYEYAYSIDFGFIDGNIKDVSLPLGDSRDTLSVFQIINYNGCIHDAEEFKLQYVVDGALAKPTRSFNCDDPLVWSFDGSGSVDFTTTKWSINDVFETNDVAFTIDFMTGGRKTILLEVNNDEGCTPHTAELDIQTGVLNANLVLPSNTLCIGVAYEFDASSSNFVFNTFRDGFDWSLPGTNLSTNNASETESFTFDTAGEYSVIIEVEDVNGCEDSDTATFKVFDIQMDWERDLIRICNPDTVGFTNATLGDTTLASWTFLFADGSPDTVFTTNPTTWSHIFNNAPEPAGSDSYATTLIVSDVLGCSDTLTQPIQRYVPTTTIVINNFNNRVCVGDSVTIEARESGNTGDLNYNWTLGDAGISTQKSITVAYDTESIQNISLFVSEIESNCLADDTIRSIVDVQDYPIASFMSNKDGDAVFCAPLLTQLNSTESTGTNLSYLWDFGDDSPNALIQNTTHTYQKGQITTTLTVTTSNGCADDTSKTFDVIGPEGRIEANLTGPICQGDEVTFTLKDTVDVTDYIWDFGDGTLDSTNTSPITYAYTSFPPTGTFPMNIIFKGVGGCSFSDELDVQIIDIVADFTLNGDSLTEVCLEDATVEITNTSLNADTYSWIYGNGETSTSADDRTITFTESGTFDFQLSVTNNSVRCVDTIVKTFVVFPEPELVTFNDTVCTNETLQIGAENINPTYRYSWSPSNGLADSSNAIQNLTIGSTTTYQVTAIDTNLCTKTSEATGFVLENLNLTETDTTIVIGDKATLNVQGAELRTLVWSPLDIALEELSCLNCNFPLAMPLEVKENIYNLTMTNTFGCDIEEYVYKVTVRPETKVRMPTTFSPNNDGNNDIVYVQGWGIKELLKFQIFNRWGEMLYESDNIEEGWNGIYKGKIQNSDSYVYKVSVLTWRDEVLNTEGYLNLIH